MVQYTYYHLGMIGTIANLLVDGNNDCDDFKHQKERFHRFSPIKNFMTLFTFAQGSMAQQQQTVTLLFDLINSLLNRFNDGASRVDKDLHHVKKTLLPHSNTSKYLLPVHA